MSNQNMYLVELEFSSQKLFRYTFVSIEIIIIIWSQSIIHEFSPTNATSSRDLISFWNLFIQVYNIQVYNKYFDLHMNEWRIKNYGNTRLSFKPHCPVINAMQWDTFSINKIHDWIFIIKAYITDGFKNPLYLTH